MISLSLLSLLTSSIAAAEYVLQSNFSGASFFDNFNFYNSWDPTFGFVHYVDRGTAQSMGLISSGNNEPAVFGVDHTGVYDPAANLGRASVRLESVQQWTHGLFIADLAHMPGTACGTWPAMWVLGGGAAPWPANGEIDIIEFPNLVRDNLMALHTSEGCTIAGSAQSGWNVNSHVQTLADPATGTLLTNDCGTDGGFAGCYVSPKKAASAGTNFNAGGGGVYAMEWTAVAIRIWFFPRGHIPPTINSPHPDTSKFGIPDANFEGGCDIDKYFNNGTLIFNIEFCGSWAGPTFVQDGCPALNVTSQWSSCNMYVAANPDAYVDSYFAVNYVHVYTTTAGTPPPSSSVLQSILPVASTSSATSGGAEGQTTTASSVSLWPPSTVSTSTPTTTSSSTASPSTSTTTSSSSYPSASNVPITCPASNNTTITSNGVVFLIECGIDHVGGDMNVISVTSFQQCIDACATTPGCVALSTLRSACYLKNYLGSPVHNGVEGAKVVDVADPTPPAGLPQSESVVTTQVVVVTHTVTVQSEARAVVSNSGFQGSSVFTA